MTHNNRFLYLSSLFPSPLNPQFGIFSLRRVQALQQMGCDIRVVSPVIVNPPPGMLNKPAQAYRWIRNRQSLPNQLTIESVSAYFPKWVCPPKKIFGWYMSASIFQQIKGMVRQLVEDFQPEAIIASWLPDGAAACQLGELFGLPTLVIADGSDLNSWAKIYPRWEYARDILNKKASTLIFVSESLKATGQALGLCGKKNIVLNNGVDINLFTPKTAPHQDQVFTVLGVGRLITIKGFQVLLPAFDELYRQLNQQAQLIIVGDGELRHELALQATALGIQSAVKFIGSVKQEELVHYYQDADLVCAPSFMEGFPCVVVEAMACGKPVVASNVGGMPEVIDPQCGILVEAGNPDDLCKGLLQAKAVHWDAELIRKKAVDHYSWSQWARSIVDLVHSEGAYAEAQG